MSITRLSKDTAGAIGSTSALHDSCSVVKELIDNALDAKATSISIEIAENTLDAIVVKDNGTGISVDGRELVCRPNCTSKLQDVEDLRRVGTQSLGFRGLAMSSIAETCETIHIITRTQQETVGASLSFGRDGSLICEKKIAHPVGTTVKVRAFLRFLPVRRQVMLKRVSSTIASIHEMVKAYALARLNVRFSMRVMGSKSSSPWTYTPKNPPSYIDATLKVCGKDIASQCEYICIPEQVSEEKDTTQLIAVLPKIDSDITKTIGSQYVSIDKRPLAPKCGFVRTVIQSFKTLFRNARQREGLGVPCARQFVYLCILNPPGDYDANIEPAKDDVLLSDESAVLLLVEDLFRQLYGRLPDAPSDKQSPNQTLESISVRSDNGTMREAGILICPQKGGVCNSSPGLRKENMSDTQTTPNLISGHWKSTKPAVTIPSRSQKPDSRYQGPFQRQSHSGNNGDSRLGDISMTVRDRSPSKKAGLQSIGTIDQWIQHAHQSPLERRDSPIDGSTTEAEIYVDEQALNHRFGSVETTEQHRIQLHSHRLAVSQSPQREQAVPALECTQELHGVPSQNRDDPDSIHQYNDALSDHHDKVIRGSKTHGEDVMAKPSVVAALPTPTTTPGRLRQSQIAEWYSTHRSCRVKGPQVAPPMQISADGQDTDIGTTGLSISITDTITDMASGFRILCMTDSYAASGMSACESEWHSKSKEALRYWSSHFASFIQNKLSSEDAAHNGQCSAADVLNEFIRKRKAC